jgi:hypothetical protein
MGGNYGNIICFKILMPNFHSYLSRFCLKAHSLLILCCGGSPVAVGYSAASLGTHLPSLVMSKNVPRQYQMSLAENNSFKVMFSCSFCLKCLYGEEIISKAGQTCVHELWECNLFFLFENKILNA